MESDKHENGPSGRTEGWEKVDAEDDPEHGQIRRVWTIGLEMASQVRAMATLRQARSGSNLLPLPLINAGTEADIGVRIEGGGRPAVVDGPTKFGKTRSAQASG
jgi:hypothetical protein